jgi:hypothetical protein
MYLHQTKACPGLKEIQKPLNPRMWLDLYNWYQSDIMLKALAEDSDFMDTLYVSDPLTDAPKKAKPSHTYPNPNPINCALISLNMDEAFSAGASQNISDDLNDSAEKASAFHIGSPGEVSDVENASDKENQEPTHIGKFRLKTPSQFRAHYMASRKRRFEKTVDKIANDL